jgi:hypothetical protein
MKRDEAIEAIRAVRHQISAEHQHNTRLLIRHYQEMDKLYAGRMLRSASPVPAPASASREDSPSGS